MRVGSILSFIFHVAIVLLLLFGLPDLFASDELVIEPVPVQLATVADLTTAPKPADVPRPEVKPTDTPPPPAPQAPPTPTPPTPPAPPQTSQTPPQPQEATASPPPAPPTPPQPQPAQTLPDLPQPDQQQPSAAPSAPIGQSLTASELDAVRSQIAGCWYIDPGKKGADTIVVEVAVTLAPDGTVQTANIVD